MAKEVSLADIEKSYDDAIAKAKGAPEVVAALQAEKAVAVTDFRLKAVAAREMALWKREALAVWPLAAEFPDMVIGDTEEAIVESAKALHERMLSRFAQHQRDLDVQKLIDDHFNPTTPEGGQTNADAGETVQQP